MPEPAPASAPGQVRGKKRVRVWPMGTMPNETRGVPYEESVISAGEIFLGASGVLHEVLTLEPSFALSANYFPFTSALFDAAYHGHEWQLEPSPPHPNRD